MAASLGEGVDESPGGHSTHCEFYDSDWAWCSFVRSRCVAAMLSLCLCRLPLGCNHSWWVSIDSVECHTGNVHTPCLVEACISSCDLWELGYACLAE